MKWLGKIVLRTIERYSWQAVEGSAIYLYQMMFFFFSESGYVYLGIINAAKRGMKKIASRQQEIANVVHAELDDEAKIEHLKEKRSQAH